LARTEVPHLLQVNLSVRFFCKEIAYDPSTN
jgi:hypothetical protein